MNLMKPLAFFLVSLKINFNIVDLQCCVNFCCTSVIPLYIYIHSFAYKLNQQGDNIQPRHTPFPILTQAVVPCSFLTVASCSAYTGSSGDRLSWSGTPISLSFPVCCDPHKGFSVVNETEVDVFLSRDQKAPKAWKYTSWSFTGKLSPPCPRALLF